MNYLEIREWVDWIEVKVFTDDGQYAHVANTLEELLKIVRKERQRHGLSLRIERVNVGKYGSSMWTQIMLPTKDEARIHRIEHFPIGR